MIRPILPIFLQQHNFSQPSFGEAIEQFQSAADGDAYIAPSVKKNSHELEKALQEKFKAFECKTRRAGCDEEEKAFLMVDIARLYEEKGDGVRAKKWKSDAVSRLRNFASDLDKVLKDRPPILDSFSGSEAEMRIVPAQAALKLWMLIASLEAELGNSQRSAESYDNALSEAVYLSEYYHHHAKNCRDHPDDAVGINVTKEPRGTLDNLEGSIAALTEGASGCERVLFPLGNILSDAMRCFEILNQPALSPDKRQKYLNKLNIVRKNAEALDVLTLEEGRKLKPATNSTARGLIEYMGHQTFGAGRGLALGVSQTIMKFFRIF